MNRLILLLLCVSFQGFCQHTKIGRNDNIYLTLNKSEAYIVQDISRKDNTEPLQKKHTFDIKRNSVDIYLDWINPLQYHVTILDTVINDIRAEEVRKFFTENIAGVAGGHGLLRPKREYSPSLVDCSAGKAAESKAAKKYPELYSDYKLDAGGFTPGSEECLAWLSLNTALDEDLPSVESGLKNLISKLYAAHTPASAADICAEGEDEIKRFRENSYDYITSIQNLKKSAVALTTQYSLKAEMLSLGDELSKSFENAKKISELLSQYIIEVRASLKEDRQSRDLINHYRIKTVTLPKSKSIRLAIKLAERKLRDDFTLDDKTGISEYEVLVQKYDFITPKVSSGLFYSSITLNGYSTEENQAGDKVIVENDLEKDTAVTGIFLNLNFDIGTSYLAPLLQIGVDPTKDKPYLLLGGGFSIAEHFSITAGPVWTWEPQLTKLAVGQVVSSDGVVEDDIEYKFKTSPKGFYLGLNYNF